MNYEELRLAYKDAGLDYNTAFIKAVNNVKLDDYVHDYYNPKYHEQIRSILSDILIEYSETKAKTKKGGVLRKIAYYLSYLVPFIKIKNEKG